MERQSLYFLSLRVEDIEVSIVGMLFQLRDGGVVSLGAASIYLTDPGQKVKGGFGLRSDSFLNGLVPSVLSIPILLSMSTDKGP